MDGSDERLFVAWLESQPDFSQTQRTREKINELLAKAAQPRYASGNGCIKLCFFIEKCRSSKSAQIRDAAFSKETCLSLFEFYSEWNEKNQHRSMSQVLELLVSLVAQHPEKGLSGAIKDTILQRLVSIITHQAPRPLVKPALKCLEFFLNKGTISTANLFTAYQNKVPTQRTQMASNAMPSAWDSFVSEIFDWMSWPDVSSAAGKLLVTLFLKLKKALATPESHAAEHTILWQRWIRKGLAKDPDALENVKNYLFPPLFKLDRQSSLAFLEDLNNQRPISDLQSQEVNAHSLLQLAAMDIGKKTGLVEELDTVQLHKITAKSTNRVILQESAIGLLLTHNLDTVRSLAFSVLVSSSSSTRPFSPSALRILKSNIGILYADTDAKFRHDTLSNTKHMIERIRGSTAFLTREIENLSLPPGRDEELQLSSQKSSQDLLNDARQLLQKHEEFVEWYLEFLMAELIPTASYQRHITALKSISLLLRSGIHDQNSILTPTPVDNATVWPRTIKFFSPGPLRLLLDLLMDPFEDVRSMATTILESASLNDLVLELPASTLEESFSSLLEPQQAPERDARLQKIKSQMSKNTTKTLPKKGTPEPLGVLLAFIDRAKHISKRTGRADYADGVGRSYKLLYGFLASTEARLSLVEDLVDDLEYKVETAEQNLAKAILKAPIHGDFAALNFIWDAVNPSTDFRDHPSQSEEDTRDQWDSLQIRMKYSCSRIWDVVKDILCNESPEGHLPPGLHAIDTKDILSYSFRAIHESSNLMRTMVSKVKCRWQDGSPMIQASVFPTVGDLTFEQLSSLRHRGAFSTVSLTFARCCELSQYQLSARMSNANDLEKWYKGALKCVFEQASTTRRSAGIPALITGILSAHPSKPAFEDVMAELKNLARQPIQQSKIDKTNLPQVHALNCLKEIFKSSILGKRSESHIADCLELAADSLRSDIWAIRNCGLLLLRSLIDCLFGTSESKVVTEVGWDGRSIRLSYEKYPALPELLVKLLDADTSGSEKLSIPTIGAVESVFPALDIIRRSGPPSSHREEIYGCVSRHLGSQVWYIREIAARTISTLLLHDDWLVAVLELLKTSYTSANRAHGVLLAVKFVLERRLELDAVLATKGLWEIAVLINGPQSHQFLEIGCPSLLSAYLEVLNAIAKALLAASTNLQDKEEYHFSAVMDHLFLPDAFEEFRDLMSRSQIFANGQKSAAKASLARKAIVHRAVYVTALREDIVGLRNVLKYAAETDIDVAIAGVECISLAWDENISAKHLIGLSEAYVMIVQISQSPDLRSTALSGLAEALDRQFHVPNQTELQHFQNFPAVQDLRYLPASGRRSLNLSNAEIRLSGSILLCDFRSAKPAPFKSMGPRMMAWGEMLHLAGYPDNEIDKRHAASAALGSFYGSPYFQTMSLDACLLPSLIALYDSLNDDDDEIRNLSAGTMSVMLGKTLTPIAAGVELVQWLSKSYSQAPFFAWNVVCRMTGNNAQFFEEETSRLQPSDSQFSKAMREDDSLFVEEEQNLYIDEVRESKLWGGIFEKILQSPLESTQTERVWGNLIEVLALWVGNGLVTLNSLAVKEDGPLGWTSKPTVFATSMRILSCAKVLVRHNESLSSLVEGSEVGLSQRKSGVEWNQKMGEILDSLKIFVALARAKNIHERLLVEVGSLQELSLKTNL